MALPDKSKLLDLRHLFSDPNSRFFASIFSKRAYSPNFLLFFRLIIYGLTFFFSSNSIQSLISIKIQGATRRGNATKEYIQQMGFKEGQVIFKCPKCCSIKPERAHHCSVSLLWRLIYRNGILFPKLFWPPVKKSVLVIEKNFWDH